MRIDKAQFPYSFYNINANKNLLNYIYLGISYTMIITPGNYNEYSSAIYKNQMYKCHSKTRKIKDEIYMQLITTYWIFLFED